jgi:glycosyltransferase involved in cell wall biosynthesis
MSAERSVLHVLPHRGGGGETYVDTLAAMDGYRFDRVHLAPALAGAARHLPRGVARAFGWAHRHDLVHVHGEAVAALCLPLLVAKPSVVTLHGLHLVRRLEGARRRAAELNLRAVVRAADRTICVSETEHELLARILGHAADRAVVIRNGVRIPPPTSPEERAATRRELGLGEDDGVAIWVGSRDERKDPLTAARAAVAASVPLLVVGEAPRPNTLDGETSPLVRVLGRRDDVPRLLAASDVFVHTARREGLSLSLLEAMAHGLAPVVSDVPENVEAIGETGIAVAPGGEAGLAAALRRLTTNPAERMALGEGARGRAAERFDAPTMVARTRALYEEVLAL